MKVRRSVCFLDSDLLIPVAMTPTTTSRKGKLVQDTSVVNFIEGLVEFALVVNCSSSSSPS